MHRWAWTTSSALSTSPAGVAKHATPESGEPVRSRRSWRDRGVPLRPQHWTGAALRLRPERSSAMRIRLVALAASLAVGLFLASATASAPASGPNAVTAWNANAGEATVAACFIGGYAPQEARMYAMMHVAVHDALNGNRPSLATLRSGLQAAPGASPDAAIAAASRDVLVPVLGSFVLLPPRGLHQRRHRQRGSGLCGRSRGDPERDGEDAWRRAGTRGCSSDPGVACRRRLRHAADGSELPGGHRARASTATRRAPPSRSPRTGARTSPPSCWRTVRSSARARRTR